MMVLIMLKERDTTYLQSRPARSFSRRSPSWNLVTDETSQQLPGDLPAILQWEFPPEFQGPLGVLVVRKHTYIQPDTACRLRSTV